MISQLEYIRELEADLAGAKSALKAMLETPGEWNQLAKTAIHKLELRSESRRVNGIRYE